MSNDKNNIDLIDIVDAICTILGVKGKFNIVEGSITGYNPKTKTFTFNNKTSDSIEAIREIAHECFHAYQDISGRTLNYNMKDRKKIENGDSYLELKYDFELEAEAFSILFINKLNANICIEENIRSIQGINNLKEEEIEYYINKFEEKYNDIKSKYDNIIGKYT